MTDATTTIKPWRHEACQLRDTLFAEMDAGGVSNTLTANWLGISLVAVYRWNSARGQHIRVPSPDMFDRIRELTSIIRKAREMGLLPLGGVPATPVTRSGRDLVFDHLQTAKNALGTN